MAHPAFAEDPTVPPGGTAGGNGQPPAQAGGRRLGTAAIALGIAGIVFAILPHVSGFGVFLGIVGLVLGIIGLRRKAQRALPGTVLSVVAIVLGGVFSGLYGSGSANSAAPAAAPSTSSAEASTAATPAETEAAATPSQAAAPAGSVAQLQALAAAKTYLDSGMGFSQAGLLAQLTSSAGNGFSQTDAQWAIDRSGADWNAQALSAAEAYLKSGMGFSEASLTQQLTSSAGNQFAPDQAAHAVANAGADWNAQAVDAAKGYIASGMGFSRQSLIDQLTSSAGNQFTPDQAAYAATQVGLN